MSGFRGSLGALMAACVATACASNGGGIAIGENRTTCAAVTGIIGTAAGAILSNHREGGASAETDELLVGGALGALTGTALGYLICREGGTLGPPWEARIDATPRSGTTPLEVTLSAEVVPEDADVERFEWDLGDGTRATGPTVSHVYQSPAPFDVQLTVTDDDGRSKTVTARINAMQPQPEVGAAPATEPPPELELQDVGFAYDSAELSADARDALDSMLEQLSADPDARIRVVGHTDSRGPEQFNLKLSEDRARRVMEYLVDNGIERDRIEVEGRGESDPIADDSSAEGRAQNRRVELEVVR